MKELGQFRATIGTSAMQFSDCFNVTLSQFNHRVLFSPIVSEHPDGMTLIRCMRNPFEIAGVVIMRIAILVVYFVARRTRSMKSFSNKAMCRKRFGLTVLAKNTGFIAAVFAILHDNAPYNRSASASNARAADFRSRI